MLSYDSFLFLLISNVHIYKISKGTEGYMMESISPCPSPPTPSFSSTKATNFALVTNYTFPIQGVNLDLSLPK